jgi:hypothetical protein
MEVIDAGQTIDVVRLRIPMGNAVAATCRPPSDDQVSSWPCCPKRLGIWPRHPGVLPAASRTLLASEQGRQP